MVSSTPISPPQVNSLIESLAQCRRFGLDENNDLNVMNAQLCLQQIREDELLRIEAIKEKRIQSCAREHERRCHLQIEDEQARTQERSRLRIQVRNFT